MAEVQPQAPDNRPNPNLPNNSPRRSVLTVVAVFGGMFLMFFMFAALTLASLDPEGLDLGGGKRVGVVEVVGQISDSKNVVRDLRRFRDDESVRGVVVRVDSPGGSVAPSQEIFHAIARTAQKKPVAVSMGSTAASGGYYVSLGAQRIFANAGTVTGSIGVITQLFDVHKVLDTVQIDVNTIKTGAYKDSGSPFRPLDAMDERFFRDLLDDVYEQFVSDIAKRREIDVEEVRKLADGRVFTGRQALDLKLVDELGTFEDTVAWVAKEAEIEGKPKIVYPPKDKTFLEELVQGGVRSFVGETKSSFTPAVEYRYVGPQ